MTSWLPFVIAAVGIILIIGIIVLLRKGWKVSEITFWPPAAKMTPPPEKPTPTDTDRFLADNKSKVGNINIDGAADTTDFTASNESEIGDISVKRNRK